MKHIFLVLLMFIGISSCSDFKDVTQDSHIESFSLEYSGKQYNSSISQSNGFVVFKKLPEDIELNQIVVDYTLSEGAVVEPDPRNIKDWTVKHTFRVTSSDNHSKRYSVYFNKKGDKFGNTFIGTLILNSEDMMAMFSGADFDKVIGNVYIELNNLNDISNLRNLKKIEGDVNIDITEFSELASMFSIDDLKQILETIVVTGDINFISF